MCVWVVCVWGLCGGCVRACGWVGCVREKKTEEEGQYEKKKNRIREKLEKKKQEFFLKRIKRKNTKKKDKKEKEEKQRKQKKLKNIWKEKIFFIKSSKS